MQELIGLRYGRLRVIEELGGSLCRCLCDCGSEKITTCNRLKRGDTKSCGCLWRESNRLQGLKHKNDICKPNDFIGQRFGHLVAEESIIPENRAPGNYWLMRCDCGGERIVSTGEFKRFNECADCLKRKRQIAAELRKAARIEAKRNRPKKRRVPKHGHSNTKGPGRGSITYSTWSAMKKRCYEINHIKYPVYGGRGIQICERWHDFRNFLADMGERPGSEFTIDRIDNDGNYEPMNCRWVRRERNLRHWLKS